MKKELVWDDIAEQWHKFRQQKFKPVYDFIEEYKPRKGKILEIGCGNCRNLIPFAKLGFECYGIDFSKKMLDQAKKFAVKNKVRIELKKADMTKIPYKKNYFDYVLHIASLHNLKTEKERIRSLQEAYRVLKPNGVVLLTVWNKLQLRFLFSKKDVFIPWFIKNKKYQRFYHLFDYFELKGLIKETKFKIVSSNIFGENLIFILKKKRKSPSIWSRLSFKGLRKLMR